MWRRKSFSIIILLVLCSSCIKQRSIVHVPSSESIHHRFPFGSTQQQNTGHTLVILQINDFHGALAPRTSSYEEQGITLNVERGGAPLLASHIRILKEKFGSNLLILDGGDAWQGTLDSNLTQGAAVVEFFNQMGVQATVLGNHEFDFGAEVISPSPQNYLELKLPPLSVQDYHPLRGNLRQRIAQAHFPFLSANVFYNKPIDDPLIRTRNMKARYQTKNFFPSRILTAGALQVGIIGVSTPLTASTTFPKFVSDLDFTDMASALVDQSAKLRQNGAQVIIALAHAGLRCTGKGDDYLEQNRIRSNQSPQGLCPKDGEIVQMIDKLPPGTVDAVLSAHTHTIVHHWINGIPVIQSGASGDYYHLMYLTLDQQGQVSPDQTRIEGPVPVCERIFSKTGQCDPKFTTPGGRGELITPELFGERITPDPDTTRMLQQLFATTKPVKERVLATAQNPVPHSSNRESALGNLITDAYRLAGKGDIAMANSGGIRISWGSGPIHYETLFNTLPFDNSIQNVQLTGQELKLMLRILTSDPGKISPMSGVKVVICRGVEPISGTDLDQDGRISPWETNRLVSAQFLDGREIKDSSLYVLTTLDFLVGGGSTMGWFMSTLPPERKNSEPIGLGRDIVEAELLKTPVINTEGNPLVDPEHPRISFQNHCVKTDPQ